MYYAIKTLEKRIQELKAERQKVEDIMMNPELIADLEWSQNDKENLDTQIQQIEKAIILMSDHGRKENG